VKVATKFTLALLLGIGVVHAGSAVIRIHREQKLFERDVARDSRQLGRALGHAVRRAWQTHGYEEVLSLIDDATDWENLVHIRWVWLDDQAEPRHTPVVAPHTLEPLGTTAKVVTREVEGERTVYTYVPVETPTGRHGALEIQDALADEQRYVTGSIVSAVVAALVLAVLCALVSWALGALLIGRRVAVLVAQARVIGAGDLSHPISLPGTDELSDLAREMASMCDGLKSALGQVDTEVSHRARAVEQLRHADRLTSVGALASGVAHELGTPINVIEGYAQLIQEDRESSERTRDNADIVVQQCRRMTQIINQLLTFTRRGPRAQTTADALEVLQETLRLISPMIRRSGVEACLQKGNDSAVVRIGSSQLQQVLTNILINGLQAMTQGGRLSVDLGRQQTVHPRLGTGHPERDFVSISVRDTGGGMDEATARQVFEPFFTTKDVGEGTGLGLSVAYGIVEDHGGWIDVASSVGKGAIFTVFLPPGQPA
jgi:signal transduction histidine kinase